MTSVVHYYDISIRGFAMATGKKGLTVYFDQALYDRVASAAKADRRSMANWIEAACDFVAPNQLGTRVMLATRIAPTLVFDDAFRPGDERTAGIVLWATLGDDRHRFEIPRKVLTDHVGEFTASNAVNFCEQNRAKIEAACRMAWSFAPRNGGPIILTDRDFQ
jgi:hypothetical protein